MSKNPPFAISAAVLSLSNAIVHELGVLSGAKLSPVPVTLRRSNRIKTIQSSLAIEGNTLTVEQITQIMDGKRIFGPKKDIEEVNNAIMLYEMLPQINPLSIVALKKAHKTLMKGIIETNGQFRPKNVGIFKGKYVAHMAPPAKRVPGLMNALFGFIKGNSGIPWLIKACVFHYELEFIHPFADGNGRMGRLWQQLLLMKEHSVFEYISVEAIIKQHQKQYYDVLGQCDSAGDSTQFIEFSLKQILGALQQYTAIATTAVNTPESRLEFAVKTLKDTWFSRKDYLQLHKDISTATASRDLVHGVKTAMLSKRGEANQVRYRFSL